MQFPDFTRCILVVPGKPLAISGLKYRFQYNRHVIELRLVEGNIGGSPFDINIFKTVVNHPCAAISFELTLDEDNPIGVFTIVW